MLHPPPFRAFFRDSKTPTINNSTKINGLYVKYHACDNFLHNKLNSFFQYYVLSCLQTTFITYIFPYCSPTDHNLHPLVYELSNLENKSKYIVVRLSVSGKKKIIIVHVWIRLIFKKLRFVLSESSVRFLLQAYSKYKTDPNTSIYKYIQGVCTKKISKGCECSES